MFNTPGANANAVKELVLCSLFLASRDIIGGINHMKSLGPIDGKNNVEKDKSKFSGREIKNKTIGIIGLGNIGGLIAIDANHLGMNVIGYDPKMTIENALKLPNNVKLCNNLKDVFKQSDYISLNIPYINKSIDEGGTHGIINDEILSFMKSDACLLNFARGELVDSVAMKKWIDNSHGKYITDFPDDLLWDHKRAVVIPHLGDYILPYSLFFPFLIS